TGASSTIYTHGMLEQSSTFDITYLYWILLFSFPVLVFIFALWAVTLFIFPTEELDRECLAAYIEAKITDLGPLTKPEKKMLCIIGTTVLLWVFHAEIGYSISMIGIFGALLTLFPY